MGMVLGIIGFLGFLGCLVWLIICAAKKQKKKNSLIGMAVAFVLFIIGVAISPVPQQMPNSSTSAQPTNAAISEMPSADTSSGVTPSSASAVISSAPASSAPASSAPASSQKSIAELRKSAKSIAYKQLARYPDKYKGQFIKFSGKVVQSMDESGLFTLRVAQGDDYDQMFLVTYSPTNDARILENDEITVYGSYEGVTTYTSTLGSDITIPAVASADIVIKD